MNEDDADTELVLNVWNCYIMVKLNLKPPDSMTIIKMLCRAINICFTALIAFD